MEESENEVTENNSNSGSFDHFSLKTLLSPQIPPKGNEHYVQTVFMLRQEASIARPGGRLVGVQKNLRTPKMTGLG